jgi:hypothetical protein
VRFTVPVFVVFGVDQLTVSQRQLERIVSACNEPRIYDQLFSEKFSGKPYPLEAALTLSSRLWMPRG